MGRLDCFVKCDWPAKYICSRWPYGSSLLSSQECHVTSEITSARDQKLVSACSNTWRFCSLLLRSTLYLQRRYLRVRIKRHVQVRQFQEMVSISSLVRLVACAAVVNALRRGLPRFSPAVPVVQAPDEPITDKNGNTLPPLNTTYFFDQLIDHNDPSKGTFKQRFWSTYVVLPRSESYSHSFLSDGSSLNLVSCPQVVF